MGIEMYSGDLLSICCGKWCSGASMWLCGGPRVLRPQLYKHACICLYLAAGASQSERSNHEPRCKPSTYYVWTVSQQLPSAISSHESHYPFAATMGKILRLKGYKYHSPTPPISLTSFLCLQALIKCSICSFQCDSWNHTYRLHFGTQGFVSLHLWREGRLFVSPVLHCLWIMRFFPLWLWLNTRAQREEWRRKR